MNFTTYLFGSTLLEQTFHRAMQMLASTSLDQIAIAVTLHFGFILVDRNAHVNVRPSALHNFVDAVCWFRSAGLRAPFSNSFVEFRVCSTVHSDHCFGSSPISLSLHYLSSGLSISSSDADDRFCYFVCSIVPE